MNVGGRFTKTVAAGVGTTTLRTLQAPFSGGTPTNGFLCSVLVTTAGTGSGTPVTFYDNTSGSGTIVGSVPANAALGAVYPFNMPLAIGLTCVNVANGPALTVSLA